MGESFIIVNLIADATPGKPNSSGPPAPPKLRLKLFAGPSNGEVL
jgi:hypothetical protein